MWACRGQTQRLLKMPGRCHFNEQWLEKDYKARAVGSGFSEIAFWRPLSVKWSPLRQIWSPKSKRFQGRTLRVTLHGATKKKQVRKTNMPKLWWNSFGIMIILQKTLSDHYEMYL